MRTLAIFFIVAVLIATASFVGRTGVDTVAAYQRHFDRIEMMVP